MEVAGIETLPETGRGVSRDATPGDAASATAPAGEASIVAGALTG
jgi:hypothetical protein